LPAGVDITIDGRIDARTLNVYLPISRAVGGTLAIFDFTPDPKYLASNARNIALGIATWLGLTWVAEANGVPGHWARVSAGQTVQLPPPPPAPVGVKTIAPAPTAPAPTPIQTAPTPTTRPTAPTVQTAPTPTTRPVTPAPAQAAPAQMIVPPVEPLPLPTPEPEGKFHGCIARFNRTRKVYAIYCPIGSQGATPGLGVYDAEYFRCLGTNCTGLGADTVTPPVPAGFVKSAEVTTLPRAGETQSGDERDKFFRLGNPLMWAAIAGTAAVVGGGGYMLYRRKRAA
jgi:LPXTG-motif cell wall-anchored protein